MKPQEIERDIKSSGIAAVQKTQIAEGQGHIVYNVLRKKMYSDAPKSIFREYCANAFDEHERLNKSDIPFEVTFPNTLEPTLKFRDYGRGLTQEQVFHFFGQFGASDKRDTNKLIGAFGLGCKVAHAYTDSFTIVSYLNGVKRIFTYYIGQDNIGDLARMGGDVKTNEPNGLEIRIAIEPKDIQQFVNKGLEVIKYFPVKPVVKGLLSPPNFDNGTLVSQGTGWRYYSGGQNKAVVMMGPIAYDINQYSLQNLDAVQQILLRSNLQIDVNIGDVDVTSSRESLEYTDRTVAAIKAKLQVVHDEMVAEASKDFASAKTEFEVRKLYHEKIQSGLGYAEILRSSLKGITWQGKQITSNVIDFEDKNTKTSKHTIVRYGHYYGRRNKRDFMIDKYSRLECTAQVETSLYFDDTDKNPLNYKRRGITLADGGVAKFQLLQTDDVADFEKVTGLKIANLKSFAAVTPAATATGRVGTGPDLAKRKKHQTKVFELDMASMVHGHSIASDNWKAKSVDLSTEKGIYMVIDRFKPVNIKTVRNFQSRFYYFRKFLKELELVGIKINVPIYGLKQGVKPENLQHFDEWVKEQVLAIPNIMEIAELGGEYNGYNFEIQASASKLKGIALEYKTLYDKIKKLHDTDNRDTMLELLDKVGVTYTKKDTLKTLKEKLFAELPLLKFLGSSSTDEPPVLDYINKTGEFAALKKK
jgi:hypothetical protein